MFPRSQREGETFIQRKTIDQVGMDELIDTVAEMRGDLEALKIELRSFLSKQTTWEDMKTINESIRKRETEVKIKEESLQTLELYFLRQQEVLRGIIQGEMYAFRREEDFRKKDSKIEKETDSNLPDQTEQTKPIIGRRKRGNSPSPATA